MIRPPGPYRVLIIDDSPTLARVLATGLERCGGIRPFVCGGAVDTVRDSLLRIHPEVIVLNLSLRRGDPLNLLDRLQAHYPVPLFALARGANRDANRALEALDRGALEILVQPACDGGAQETFIGGLAVKIRTAILTARPLVTGVADVAEAAPDCDPRFDPTQYLVGIGASTGGTHALEELLRQTPANFPAIVIVQHMPAGFTQTFAARLNDRSAVTVSEAKEGQMVGPGQAVVARGDTHLIARPNGRGWCVRYTDQQLVGRHCPSVDVLLESVAGAAGCNAVGVLMTGMGGDGARGLLGIRQAGGLTVTQNQQSCVVYGMPKVAVELGASMYSATPRDTPALVLRKLEARERSGDCQRTWRV